MKLIPDALAQTEQPAAVTPPAPATPAPSTPAQTTQTGTAASGAPDAASQPPSISDLVAQLVPIFVVMGIVYILVIRPRARREKEQLAALRNVRRGDTIVTTGGLVGKVTKSIDDNEVELEIAANTRIRLLRTAIAEVRAKGEPVKEQPAAPAKPANESKAPAKSAPKPDAKAKS
ncbi:preprotein translocase subunit YajC [Methylocystis sp. IM3]|jgi:preprotein translocase subunit YajC|uniref:preprotein translocase subunit YajC n=1 Tax=unclassified Methylocystis TaxID=2625913 RepID=UPI0030FB11EA